MIAWVEVSGHWYDILRVVTVLLGFFLAGIVLVFILRQQSLRSWRSLLLFSYLLFIADSQAVIIDKIGDHSYHWWPISIIFVSYLLALIASIQMYRQSIRRAE